MIYQTLYAKDNNDKIRVWEIGIENNMIYMDHGELGGSVQRKTESVPEGKGGRSRVQQMQSRMDSRINKKLDAGYVESITAARDNKRTNAAGLLKPMLAKPLKDVRDADYSNCYVQHKYDGNRCLITNQNGIIIAYSRNGKPMNNLDHILCDIDIPENTTIDGELYCHNVPLQTIASWVKRKQEATERIKYHAYDVISAKPYGERFNDLMNLQLTGASEVAETYNVHSFEEVQRHFRTSRNTGYEGAIVRLDDYGYQDGKRSKGLIKVKEWMDDEFRVINIIPSEDGWAILVCDLPTDWGKMPRSFKVSAPGTIDEKFKVMINKEVYIGKWIRVEFAQYTKDGVPFHPVATMWRDKENE